MDKMAKLGEKDQNVAFLGVVFLENLLVSLSLDQKEQNRFGHPQFYSLIAPMFMEDNFFVIPKKLKF